MSARPKVITKSDPSQLTIEWSDGEVSRWSAAELRGLCPCAACVSEPPGRRMHDPASVPRDLEHRNVVLVGNYAIAIAFGDGHDTGIFPYVFLRENAP